MKKEKRLCPNKWESYDISEMLIVKQRPVDIYLCPLCGNEVEIVGKRHAHKRIVYKGGSIK